MKSNFKLPDDNDPLFDSIEYVELQKRDVQALVERFEIFDKKFCILINIFSLLQHLTIGSIVMGCEWSYVMMKSNSLPKLLYFNLEFNTAIIFTWKLLLNFSLYPYFVDFFSMLSIPNDQIIKKSMIKNRLNNEALLTPGELVRVLTMG